MLFYAAALERYTQQEVATSAHDADLNHGCCCSHGRRLIRGRGIPVPILRHSKQHQPPLVEGMAGQELALNAAEEGMVAVQWDSSEAPGPLGPKPEPDQQTNSDSDWCFVQQSMFAICGQQLWATMLVIPCQLPGPSFPCLLFSQAGPLFLPNFFLVYLAELFRG